MGTEDGIFDEDEPEVGYRAKTTKEGTHLWVEVSETIGDGEAVYTAKVSRHEISTDVIDRAVGAAIRSSVDDRIRKSVDEIITKMVTERAGPIIDDVLENGWQTFDQWGRPEKVVTLKQKIAEFISSVPDSYNRKTMVQKAIEDAVNKALDRSFQTELDAARAGFRKQVDDLLSGKIAEGLRAAFGLGR
jgi:hypothetical protein